MAQNDLGNIRLPESLPRSKIEDAAKQSGMTKNKFVVTAIKNAIKRIARKKAV